MTPSRLAFCLTLFCAVFPLQSLRADDPGWDELENWAAEESSSSGQQMPGAVPSAGSAGTQSPAAAEPVPSDSGDASSSLEKAPVFENKPPALLEPVLIPKVVRAAIPVVPAAAGPSGSRGAAASSAMAMPSRVSLAGAGQASVSEPQEPPASAPSPALNARYKNLFAEQFYMNPDLKLRHQITEVDGFLFAESPGRGGRPEYALVTAFGGNVIRKQKLGPHEDLEAARKWLKENLESQNFEGVEVRKLKLPADPGAQPKEIFWVGNRSYATSDKAFSEIAMAKTAVETQGGSFTAMVAEAQTVPLLPEEKPPVQLTPAEFEKQERIVLKMMDSLDIGNELFGPFQGEASGESIVWQSFGETSWRMTNLASEGYDSQVGFWTNRILFKGIRAPLSTIDPFVESTVAMESNGEDFKDNMKLWAGLEWRPFSQNYALLNFRPWGLPLLEWVRNYRLYVMYGENINLKDEIEGGPADTDLVWGAQIFYEWGADLPPAGESGPSGVPDYLREYIWGEYFGNYRVEKTNFGTQDDFNAWILNSSLILGFRLPGIPLPHNPINDELVLMPYMHFEHVNNTRFSFPFQNQYFVGAGMRWMPFRTYRFKENEWLSKVKVFGEYVGVGDVQHAKQDGEAPNAVRYDWRIGVSMSSRRF